MILSAHAKSLSRADWCWSVLCWASWVKFFSYLRGLDGITPTKVKMKFKNDQNSEGPSNEIGGTDRQAPDIKKWERPEGQSQLDYVRRLVHRLEESKNPKSSIKAIGVLGTDVYDKLLILRALKKRFPQAIFFTTDLDARLFHPEEYNWTRNLIIASHFGLQLNPTIQSGIPPFRDSYQTSEFLSVLHAINYFTPFRENLFFIKNDITKIYGLPQPRIFEIGRTGPIDLSLEVDPPQRPLLSISTAPNSSNNEEKIPHLEWGGFIHDDRPPTRATWEEFFFILLRVTFGSLIIIALLMPASQNLRESLFFYVSWFKVDFYKAAITSLIPLIFLFVIPLGFYFLSINQEGYRGEPFYWLEGVSVWPSGMIRYFSILLCFVFIFIGVKNLDVDTKLITEEIFPGFQVPHIKPIDALFWGIFSYVRPDSLIRTFFNFPKEITESYPKEQSNQKDGLQLRWFEFLSMGQSKYRLIRSVIFASLFMIVTILFLKFIMGFDKPNLPCRGTLGCYVNKAVLFSSVLSMLILIFFVLDATRLCQRLIESFKHFQAEWPRGIINAYEKKRNISPVLLNDWLNVQVTGMLTGSVGKLILYPFAILSLLLVARSSYFDDFDFTIGLAIAISLSCTFALYSALALRRAAEQLRVQTIQKFENLKVGLLQTEIEKDFTFFQNFGIRRERSAAASINYNQVEALIMEVKTYKEGAFQPFARHPIFKAILYPFGGYGALAILEYLFINF